MKAIQSRHWTERSVDDFVHKISSDFVLQLDKKMKAEHVSPAALAAALGVTAGRVSQVLNDPGNLTLRNCIRYARSLGMKTALIAYDDGDPQNNNGPINSDIFYRCWQRSGSPTDFFELTNQSGRLRTVMTPIRTGGYVLTVQLPQWKEQAADTRDSVGSLDIGELVAQPATTSEEELAYQT